MNTYLITYDVADDVQANQVKPASAVYSDLIATIKSYGQWAKITESCWAVVSDTTACAIRDQLLALMRNPDRLMVVQSAHSAAWHNTFCRNEWLKASI